MEGCGLLHGRIWFVFMSGRVWFMTVVLRIPIAHNVCKDPFFSPQARDYAKTLENAIWTNQFDNQANRKAHFETTGPEIWQQTGK